MYEAGSNKLGFDLKSVTDLELHLSLSDTWETQLKHGWTCPSKVKLDHIWAKSNYTHMISCLFWSIYDYSMYLYKG